MTAALAISMLLSATPCARAQSAVVVVNGDPITNFDIEQRSKLLGMGGGKVPGRQDVLNQLIDDRLKVKEAKKYSLDLTPAELDEQYSSVSTRMRLNPDQLNKVLAARGIRPETLKARLKADYLWSQLVRGRYQQSLLVGDKDVNSAIEVKGDGKQSTDSFEYQMRPVVLIVANGASGLMESRRKEAEALRSKIQSCDEAAETFRLLKDSIFRDTVTKTSADLPQPLRELLDKTPIGHLTPPETTRQGIEMVALCGRKPTTIDTPEKRAARDKLYAQKYEVTSNKYLRDLRRAAMIERR